MSHNLAPYALIIAEVLDKQGGDVRIRLIADSGEPSEIWIDESPTVPLSKDDAVEVSERWNIALPGWQKKEG